MDTYDDRKLTTEGDFTKRAENVTAKRVNNVIDELP